MNILFLTSRFPTASKHFTLEKELVYAFNKDGHNCIVANILERKNQKLSYISSIKISDSNNELKSDIKLLNIKTGNLFNDVNFLEKKITALTLSYIFPQTIKKLIPNQQIDLIIAYGPYLCGYGIIKPLKQYYNCKAILMQWDIFPQNAYDLGIIKNKLIYNYLKYKQKLMLEQYDLILCNSQGNIDYLNQKLPKQTQDKSFLFHNCESIRDNISANQLKQTLRAHYGIPENATALIFGGNIGVPQALDNIVNLAEQLNNNKIFFIIIGQGTEAKKIKLLCANKSNMKFIDYIPSQEYEQLLAVCDYGIISLSPKFTVPNFPAKVTSYLKIGLPIFACLDDSSYNDLGKFIQSHNIGYAVKAKNISTSIDKITEFLLDTDNHKNLKAKSTEVFNSYFDIDKKFSGVMGKIKKVIVHQ